MASGIYTGDNPTAPMPRCENCCRPWLECLNTPCPAPLLHKETPGQRQWRENMAWRERVGEMDIIPFSQKFQVGRSTLTPGDWNWECFPYEVIHIDAIENEGTDDEEWHNVAFLTSNNPADAWLITHAKEMLDLLCEMAEDFDNDQALYPRGRYDERLHDLIERATGRAFNTRPEDEEPKH